MIASHPNGYKCDTFAKRTIAAWTDGSVEHALGQFDYIIVCGGRGVERDMAEALARGEVEQLFDSRPSLAI
jgi:hypothetical protein